MWFNKFHLETGERPTEHTYTVNTTEKNFLVLTYNLLSLFYI